MYNYGIYILWIGFIVQLITGGTPSGLIYGNFDGA